MADDDEASEPNLPVAVETAVGMLPDSWRDKALHMAVRFVGKRFLPDHYREMSQEREAARARAIITDKVAEAAGEMMAKDPAFVQRATARWFSDQTEKQENLEAIVLEATGQIEHTVGADEVPTDDEITDDWRRKFTNFAEDISEPEMRTVWARLLAGEFRKPGSFSYRTLRLISEIDAEVADTFRNLSARVITGNALLSSENWSSGEGFDKISQLVDVGLLLDSPGSVARTLSSQHSSFFVVPGSETAGVIETKKGTAPQEVQLPIVRLTTAGMELLNLIDRQDDEPMLREAMEIIRDKLKVPTRASIYKRLPSSDLLDPSNAKVLWDDLETVPPVPAP